MKQLLAIAAAASAVLGPLAFAAPGDDPRIKMVDYAQGRLTSLATSPETMQTLLFASGERLQSVVASDPGAYQIYVSSTGDSLTLKANGSSALAILSIRTDQRSYELELIPGTAAAAAPVIRFNYSQPAGRLRPAGSPSLPEQAQGHNWRIGGAKALRPLTVRDDGAKTYIEWRPDQSMPAVFAIHPTGREEMVDSYVRDGLLTIDHVHPSLIFRIDKAKASAQRTQRKKNDG